MPSNNYCFWRKKDIVPRCCPASKIACALNSRSWPGWNRHLVNSAAPRGQHVVKCVLNPGIVVALNPHYLPPSCGGREAFPSFCLNFVFARWILIVSRHFEINLYCMRQTGNDSLIWHLQEHLSFNFKYGFEGFWGPYPVNKTIKYDEYALEL